ncbi:putative thiamine biosynthesis protein [compost metagenome]
MRVWMGLALGIALGLGLSAPAQAMDRIGLSLQGKPQARFAGYYVAKAKGFYQHEGIDLALRPLGRAMRPFEPLLDDEVKFHVGWVGELLAQRDQGQPVVGIMQVVQRSTMLLLGRRSQGLRAPSDLAGQTMGIWLGRDTAPRAFLERQGLTGQVKLVPQGFAMASFIERDLPVVSALRDDEYYTALQELKRRMQDPSDLIAFELADFGLDFPEDALITQQATVKDERGLCERMVRATKAGWEYALAHPQEAVDLMIQANPSLDRAHQEWMLKELGRTIVAGPAATEGIGYVPLRAIQAQIEVMREFRELSAPQKAEEAFAPEVWDRALGKSAALN